MANDLPRARELRNELSQNAMRSEKGKQNGRENGRKFAQCFFKNAYQIFIQIRETTLV